MPIAVRDQVEPVLANFAHRIQGVLDQAMEDWEKMPNKSWLIFRRDQANIIFSYVARHALVEFADDHDVHVMPESQTVKFLFRDAVLIRFKKGNAAGVGSNIVTQSVLEFIDPQLSFSGLPDVQRVEIVYQLNVIGTGYKEVAVVARDKRARIWAYPLNGKSSAEIIPLPPRPAPVLTPPSVIPKPIKKEQSQDDDQKE